MMLKMIYIFILLFNFQAVANLPTALKCNGQTQGGDLFPWCLAKPVPTDEILGYWRSEDDPYFYIHIRPKNLIENPKKIDLFFHSGDLCSAPLAYGLGFVDTVEKNVIRSVVQDQNSENKYTLKLAIFNSMDLNCFDFHSQNVMGVSMRLINTNMKSSQASFMLNQRTANIFNHTNSYNMIFRKIIPDINNLCEMNK